MRKVLAVLSGVFLFLTGYSQKAVKLSMGIKPHFSYDQTITQKIKLEINLDSSSQEMLSKMDSAGMKNPTFQEQETQMETLIKSGSVNPMTGKIPVTMRFLKASDKLARFLTPDLIFYGESSAEGMPIYDSISGTTLDEKQKQQILKMSSIVSQISLPVKKLKVGESDTVNNPIDIPIGGMSLKMDYLTIYHLKSILGNTAYFDLAAQFKLNMEVREIPVEGTGSGAGVMEYDLTNQFPSHFNLTYQINMRIEKEGMIAHMKMTESLENNCQITSLR